MCTGFDFTTKLIIKYVYRFSFSTKFVIKNMYRYWFYNQIDYQICVPVLILPPNWLWSMCAGFDLAPNLLTSMCTDFDFTTKLIFKYVYLFWFYHQINYQVRVPVLILPAN
jgi:hypothetical protein